MLEKCGISVHRTMSLTGPGVITPNQLFTSLRGWRIHRTVCMRPEPRAASCRSDADIKGDVCATQILFDSRASSVS